MGRTEAIYARQSVDKKDSVSIETQIEKCEYHTNGKSEVYKDKGYSGKNTDRLYVVSQGLGHNRIDVTYNFYIK